ncbi:hypothetical protein [Nonomuraea maritima]|uniref:hypothetical protein n=1 Tax=Nonomuraea maritima TaxID=683260 RepID=UPI0037129FBF
MGRRHGKGESDDRDEWGHSAFWGPDEQAEPPGWPSLPDEPEVTGQWAPMPQRPDAPPPRASQSEPYETTGASAAAGPQQGGFPPAPGPGDEEAGPYETTGAFARPPEWDAPPNRPFTDVQAPSTGDFEPGDLFRGAAERSSFFGEAPDAAPDRRDAFDRAGDGMRNPFEEAGDRTARFDAPPAPAYGGPPEPGDVKVAGSPMPMPTPPPTPAWAEAETGFLGSGPSEDLSSPGGDEPRGRRGRRRQERDDELLAAPASAGRGRVALLSVAAVAVVLGGTVAGVKFLSGTPAACEGTSCSAVQSTSEPAATDEPDAVEEDSEALPEDEPSEEVEEETADPETTAPTAGTPVRKPSNSATPTKAARQEKPERQQDTQAEPPADRQAEQPQDQPTETPSEEATVLDENATGDMQTTPKPENTSAPIETLVPEVPERQSGADNSVGVRQTISQRPATYRASVAVSNTSKRTLASPTVSVPVNGKVTNVSGAEWTQDGDLLILELENPLAAGQTVKVSFTATGKGSKAANCGLVSGDCAVS